MRSRWHRYFTVALFAGGVFFFSTASLRAQDREPAATKPAGTYPIDLPTVLKLANARNLDVQIARQRSAEAKAIYDSAVMQFFPWLSPGVTYRRHDNFIQDVAGNILDTHKESYAPGLTLGGQVDVGNALYNSLAAKQSLQAAYHGVDVQRQNAGLGAARDYFELLQAQALAGVAEEARNISRDYERQIAHAVDAGLAFKGDQLRVQVQTGQTELVLRRAEEQRRIAGARLAEILHLEASVELVADDRELVPLALIETNATLAGLLGEALSQRPELQQSHALVSAAKSAREGAVVGPLIPTIAGQAFAGGLGGGIDHMPSRFGQSEDYTVFLGWRIGPGGLFDFGRIHQTKAQSEILRLADEKLRDGIIREVVESHTAFQSASDQLGSVNQTLTAAIQAQKLAGQRKEFAVGAVLEDIQTQEDLTRARGDYVNVVAEYNKAQYALQQAIGRTPMVKDSSSEPPAAPAAHTR